jgi:hypothetical protein
MGMRIDYKKLKHNNNKTIPLLSGRPKRDTAIGKDDILNLIILLNTTNDVNEIINQI